MPYVQSSLSINSKPDAVWAVLGAFDNLAWLPSVQHCWMESPTVSATDRGAVRRLVLRDGVVVREQLYSHSDRNRTYCYLMLSGPLPIEDYVALIGVSEGEAPGTSVVEWHATFNVTGSSVEAVVGAVKGRFDSGLTKLAAMMAAA